MARTTRVNLIVGTLALVFALVHLASGSTLWIAPWNLFSEAHAAIGSLRLPRVLLCLVGGASLGVSGVVFQAIFRNPIAEPYLLGVSGGAAIGGSVAALTGVFLWAGGLMGPLVAMGAGLLTLPLVLALAGRGEHSTERLLIGGVVIGSLLAALNTVVILLAGADSNQVLRWLLGTAANGNLAQVALLAGLLVAGFVFLRSRLTGLHLLMVSPDSAQTLGVSPRRLIRESLWVGTALSAGVVGVMGLIGFIGLVAPHIARSLQGQAPRDSVLTAGLVGAALLTVADLVSQRAGELPVGAITALVGAPTLLWLLRRA